MDGSWKRRITLGTLAVVLALCGCSGSKPIRKLKVRDLVVQLPDGVFDREDITVDTVNQVGGGDAIAVVNIRTALKLRKTGKDWRIQEIRIGNHRWERLEDILQALDDIKTQRTREALLEVLAATEQYRRKKGALPDFTDYVSLSDMLSPQYLPRVVRVDGWQNPFMARRTGPSTLLLFSAGPDGQFGSSDDITKTKTFQ